MPSLDLTNRTTFRSSVKAATLAALRQYYGPRFTSALSIKDTVYEDQGALRAYPNVNQLRLEPSPGEIITVPAKFVDGDRKSVV